MSELILSCYLNEATSPILTLIILPIGIWFAFGDTSILNQIPKLDNPNLRKIIGWLSIAIVFVAIIFLIICLLSKKSGLVIDEVGIVDNSQIISKSVLFWSEIDNVEKTKLGLFFIKISAIKINFKDSDQKPRYLSSSLLKISDEELQNEIQLYLKKTTANISLAE